MDIPANILEDLKCGSCEGYLSRGPVYLQHDGAGICGQCYAPNRPATLNKQYQAVAKLWKFPCRNWDLGCRETVPFAEEAEEITHEAVCKYRRYMCPLLSSAHCDWLGPRTAMLAHCREQHPDRVVDNPFSLTHDITTASVHNYIIAAFEVLFLLHTKVCVATGKIYHAVRLVGSNHASNYSYTLNIKRDTALISKKGQVAPEGCLAIQEDSSLALDINGLLGLLGALDGTTFTVNLKRNFQAARPRERCRACSAVLTCAGGWCERCAPAKRVCENKFRGCLYTDNPGKCIKHQQFFCRRSNFCNICCAAVFRGSLTAHYGSAHQDITHRPGSTWRTKQSTTQWQHCLLSRAARTAVCGYLLTDAQFILQVYIPVPSEQLHKFRCSVQVAATGHTRTFTPDLRYDKDYDWRIELNRDIFPLWNGTFDVTVDISRVA